MLYVSHLQIDTKHVKIDIILVNKFQKRVMFTLYCTTQLDTWLLLPRHSVNVPLKRFVAMWQNITHFEIYFLKCIFFQTIKWGNKFKYFQLKSPCLLNEKQ